MVDQVLGLEGINDRNRMADCKSTRFDRSPSPAARCSVPLFLNGNFAYLAAACCRQLVWRLLPDEACRSAVEMSERFAMAGEKERIEACSPAAAEVAQALIQTGNNERDNPGTGFFVRAVAMWTLLGQHS